MGDFLWPPTVIASSDTCTAPLGPTRFVVRNRTPWNVSIVGPVVATPLMMTFLVFQHRFIHGISASGVEE